MLNEFTSRKIIVIKSDVANSHWNFDAWYIIINVIFCYDKAKSTYLKKNYYPTDEQLKFIHFNPAITLFK